jgi:hypothetical protein
MQAQLSQLNQLNYGDSLDTLPTDPKEIPLSFKEKTMFDSLYPEIPAKKAEIKANIKAIETFVQEAPKESKKIWVSFRDIFIATIIFVIFQFPFVEDLLTKVTKSTNFTYRLLVKSVLFAGIFFFLTNLSLARS